MSNTPLSGQCLYYCLHLTEACECDFVAINDERPSIISDFRLRSTNNDYDTNGINFFFFFSPSVKSIEYAVRYRYLVSYMVLRAL